MKDALSLITIILGSNVVIEVIKHVLTRNQTEAGTIKLRNEAGNVVLEGELKVSDFYKKEWQEMLSRNEMIESKIEKLEEDIKDVRDEIEYIKNENDELKREITLLRTIQP